LYLHIEYIEYVQGPLMRVMLPTSIKPNLLSAQQPMLAWWHAVASWRAPCACAGRRTSAAAQVLTSCARWSGACRADGGSWAQHDNQQPFSHKHTFTQCVYPDYWFRCKDKALFHPCTCYLAL